MLVADCITWSAVAARGDMCGARAGGVVLLHATVVAAQSDRSLVGEPADRL